MSKTYTTFTREQVSEILRRHSGNISAAGRELGYSTPSKFRYHVKRHGLSEFARELRDEALHERHHSKMRELIDRFDGRLVAIGNHLNISPQAVGARIQNAGLRDYADEKRAAARRPAPKQINPTREQLLEAMRHNSGNLSATARALGYYPNAAAIRHLFKRWPDLRDYADRLKAEAVKAGLVVSRSGRKIPRPSKTALKDALREHNGNIKRAAHSSDAGYILFRRWVKDCGLREFALELRLDAQLDPLGLAANDDGALRKFCTICHEELHQQPDEPRKAYLVRFAHPHCTARE